jgi:hypothetical protein
MDEDILNASTDELPDDVQKKLANIIEKYRQLSDEDKEEFRKGAFNVLKKQTLAKLSSSSILPTWLVPYESYILFLLAVTIVILLLGTLFLVFTCNICEFMCFVARNDV